MKSFISQRKDSSITETEGCLGRKDIYVTEGRGKNEKRGGINKIAKAETSRVKVKHENLKDRVTIEK